MGPFRAPLDRRERGCSTARLSRLRLLTSLTCLFARRNWGLESLSALVGNATASIAKVKRYKESRHLGFVAEVPV